ncbi:MAG: DsbA family protein [Candidatus Uhrbacteria bacterium]|nr:DsbA family protein [Candidatus Uhrbacteria bacterium]
MNEPKRGFFDGNPKMLFAFGLVTGVALTSILGGSISLPSFASGDGNSVVRSFDTADTADTGDSADTGSVAVLAPITADEHIRGDIQNAKVVLVEYSDFECPFCGRHHPTMLDIMDNYGDDVAWVYRHFPLSFHAEAEPAALASECAAEQDKFWEFADVMFENQDELSDELYLTVAGDIGLDVSAFTECYESNAYSASIEEDLASGQLAGVRGTPATFVNGIMVSGAVPYDTLIDIIDQALAE